MNEEEFSVLERITEATGMKKSAVLKSVLRSTLIDTSLVYESLQRISESADKGNCDKCREECLRLCQIMAYISNS